jgi:predicted nucleotide-binding protein
MTIIEKIERHSSVGYAVVLLTPDDVGAKKPADRALGSEDLRFRARQNVILELGYFLAFLGRNKVCALTVNDLELPSDVAGIVYVPVDAAGAWKFRLAREMEESGIQIDFNLLKTM